MRIYFHLSHRDDPNIIRYIMNGFSGPVATLLYKFHISANAVTVFRGLLVLYGLYCFSTGEYIFYLQGAIIIVLNVFLDCVDGDLARLHNDETELGEWLEGVIGHVLSQIHSLTGFFIALGIYKQTDDVQVWYVLFFILYGYIMNGVLKDFSFHQTGTVESMKQGFQSEYDKINRISFLKRAYFTLLSLNEYIILLCVIFYKPLFQITGINPLLMALLIICLIYQIRWLTRVAVQVKYFLAK